MTPLHPLEDRTISRPPEQWRSAIPFVVIGSVSIIAGGLVAAVSRPTGFDLGPWLAAFLVLVAGVAQIAFGAGQAWLSGREIPLQVIRVELVAFNLGAGATILGSLAQVPLVTTIGGVATILAVAAFLSMVVKSIAGPRWARWLYIVGATVILVSTPIGLLLAWTGH